MEEGEAVMETIQHYRAMLGFCRQRAQMEGESEAFWLEHAATIEKMLVTLERMQDLGIDIETAAEAAKDNRPRTASRHASSSPAASTRPKTLGL
jgi:hypothetical protein